MKKFNTVKKIIVIVIVAVVFFAAGFITASKLNSGDEQTMDSSHDQICFYATITEIYESSILVDGMDVNDYNYRDEFDCSISEETEITWRGTELSFEDLDVGDSIAVYFSGEVTETSPGGISEVSKIALLDDEL